MADQVVIDRSYFDVLLKRSSEYGALRRALLEAGVEDETVDLLVRTELEAEFDLLWASEAPSPHPNTTFHTQHSKLPESSKVSQPQATVPNYCNRNDFYYQAGPSKTIPVRDVDFDDVLDCPESGDSEMGWQQVTDKPNEYRLKRSLVFKNLPPGVSLKDIVDILRGGKILDIYIGSKERQALVSFVDASVAKAFLKWTDLNPINIRWQMVSVSYAEKSFHATKHVEQSIDRGATRNLLLKGMSSDFDEQRIREDLEHIHNLVIVELYPPETGKGIVISLNAIHLALYARTCMRSRAIYKKAQITFYPDKCAKIPIPQTQSPCLRSLAGNSRPQATQDSKPSSTNRFSVLASTITDIEDWETAQG